MSNSRRGSRLSRWLLGILLLMAWLFAANHTIVITGDPALVFLSKTSWSFNAGVIIEESWADFAVSHPILSTRILADQGWWVLGR